MTRHTCAACGGGSKKAYWDTEERQRVVARCIDCGANFNGPGHWVPSAWAKHSPRGLDITVDPHASHQHGHSRCAGMDKRQISLFGGN